MDEELNKLLEILDQRQIRHSFNASEHLTVASYLNLSNQPIKRLPNNLTVLGYLNTTSGNWSHGGKKL